MEERVNYCQVVNYVSIEENLYNRLNKLGMIPNETRKANVGNSNYAKHLIQPWSIWIDYNLNAWDADIVKRVLRTKSEPGISEKEARVLLDICKNADEEEEKLLLESAQESNSYFASSIFYSLRNCFNIFLL